MEHQLNDQEIQFIKDFYTENGTQYCAENLGVDVETIRKKARALKLKVSHDARTKISKINYYSNYPHLDPLLAEKIFSEWPDIWVYLLGYIWADGHLEKNTYRVRLGVKEEDGEHIKNILSQNEIFNFIKIRPQKRKRENWKDTIVFEFSDKNIYSKLKEFNYLEKSRAQASILDIIPQDKIHL